MPTNYIIVVCNNHNHGVLMKRNIGTIDMFIRLTLGVILGYLGFLDNPVISASISKILIGVCGVVVFASAIIRNCPLYYIIGLNTCSRNK